MCTPRCIVVYMPTTTDTIPAGATRAAALPRKGVAMSAIISTPAAFASEVQADLRAYVVARTERQMRTEQARAVAILMGDGHSFEAIRDALVERVLGNPNWKAGLR